MLRPPRLNLSSLQSGLGLLIIVLLAILTSPRTGAGDRIFLQAGNLTDILRQVSEIGIMAVGMTLVILTAGIDLSVGSTLALSTSLAGLCLTSSGKIWLAIVCALAGSALVGALNGLVIANLRIQPFIVTLASMIGVRGLARRLTNNTNIDFGFGSDAGSVFARLGSDKTTVIIMFAIVFAVFSVLLSLTVFGRRVRAIGDNQTAALYAGLPIKRTKIYVYTWCGFLAGLAGIIYAAQNHQANPNAGISYELEAIAAVVIGGTSLAGGKGSMTGTLIGTLIMGILTNMLRLNNVDSNTEMMLKAVIIIAAVWIQQFNAAGFRKREST
ncbi:MAG TPA: ABC transporter permease [Bryobacteraceae bacterium]|nr:ABC transporter permease [Bryobacteraceae bacterium]